MTISRLEWAPAPGAAPEQWILLETDDGHAAKIPGPCDTWFPKEFYVWDDDRRQRLHCYFEEWSPEHEGVAVYFTEVFDPEFGVGGGARGSFLPCVHMLPHYHRRGVVLQSRICNIERCNCIAGPGRFTACFDYGAYHGSNQGDG